MKAVGWCSFFDRFASLPVCKWYLCLCEVVQISG